jgi:hypothetical protein
MNPTIKGVKAFNPVAPKRNGALSQHKMWQLDFRYVRILLIAGAIGCSLCYWHERFERPMTERCLYSGGCHQSRGPGKRALKKNRSRR